MNEKAIVRGKLLELLAQAGFAERYYAYCDTHPLDFSAAKPTREAMQKAPRRSPCHAVVSQRELKVWL